MRWVVAALVVAVVALWLRVSTHRCRLDRLDDHTGRWRVAAPVCGEVGPPLGPGKRAYMCSRPDGHAGAHQADGSDLRVLDTWPQREDAA